MQFITNLNNMKSYYSYLFFLCFNFFAWTQEENLKENDSIKTLESITIHSLKISPERMPDVKKNVIYSGKKNEVLNLTNINANLVTNNAREVFSKVPGVSIWENDGSGIQINIGLRGLSPNRSWELNTRQNGFDISSDVFGYPEAYYNPPLEAVEKIELIRGGASLQFGPQFGGMINYVLKRENNKKFSFETQNAVGSFNTMSSFNAIGGKINKFSYYVYNHSRSADGWRENSGYHVRNSHIYLAYEFSEKTKIAAEYTNMNYQMRQPGGLTDQQFQENPRQSDRERNWFGTPWQLFAIHFDTKFNKSWSSSTKLFGLVGERNSVGFMATPNVADAINSNTLQYANRRVDRDLYENYGIENRNIYNFNIGKIENNLAFGLRAYRANTVRLQNGRGTTGSDFDLNIENKYLLDIDFYTNNLAFFAENQFKINDKFSVTPGVRLEYISSEGQGRLGISSNGNELIFEKNKIERTQPLFGLGLEYKFYSTNIYANISQAYRPVLFSDITPPAVTDVIDPNLKDASGFNADFGYRGTINNYLNFDIGLFYMKYSNRIGGVRQFVNNDPTQGTFLFRTNLGETVSKGIESFVNFNITRFFNVDQKFGNVEIFSTMSFIDARYTDFSIFSQSSQTPNVINESNLEGKRVENAPRYIHNFGLAWSKNNFSTTLQYRMTGRVFTDANNTIEPSANGVTGLLDDYKVIDFAGEYKFFKNYNLRAGINNLTNEMFATRRAAGYPGPGILPGEGRTFFLSIGAKF